MKKTNKKQAAAWLLSLLPLVMIAAVYRRLPAEVPMHWDLDGAVDYGAKAQLWVIAAMAGARGDVLLPAEDRPEKQKLR